MERATIRSASGPVLVVLAAGTMAGCSDARQVEGECRDVYGEEVCTFAEYEGEELVALGVTFPVAVAQDAPERLRTTWPPEPVAVLELPAGVSARTGFTHFELNWEHRGHQPATFLEPHFDFHFYTIASDQLETIYCDDTTKPAVLPAGYVLPDAVDPEHGEQPGLCVPAMGMHAMPAAQLASPDRFTATVLLGYYGGQLVFVEPMISRARLLERKAFELPVPSLAELQEGADYPTRFRAEYDEGSATYRLVLSGFAAR